MLVTIQMLNVACTGKQLGERDLLAYLETTFTLAKNSTLFNRDSSFEPSVLETVDLRIVCLRTSDCETCVFEQACGEPSWIQLRHVWFS